MTALYKSLDETVAAIREDCEAQLKDARDKVLAAEIRSTLLEQHLSEAKADRDSAVRIATKLITQFATVSKVFEEAKALALSVERGQTAVAAAAEQPPTNVSVKVPSNVMELSTNAPLNTQ